MYPPPRAMPMGCKKRQYPDGLQQFSSLPKRLFSSSESERSSSIDNPSVSHGNAINSSTGSLCNSSSSALINTDCSTNTCPTQISDAASFKLEGAGSMHSIIPSLCENTKLGPSGSERAASGGTIGFVLSRISSDASSSKLADASSLHSSRPCKAASYPQAKGKGTWTYQSASAKREGLGCEGELSEVTFEKHSRRLLSSHAAGEVSGSEKTTHVISRRDVRTLSSSDELWHKGAYGHGDYMSRGKQWENSNMLRVAGQRRDVTISSMVCESASSCATGDLHVEDIRPKQTLSHTYWSAREESSTTPFHTLSRAGVLVGSRSQKRIGLQDDYIFEGHPNSEVSLNPLTHKATPEELSPSYVLSSGRMSLEEEARLGRRAPTIDHDFEEYFSSLML